MERQPTLFGTLISLRPLTLEDHAPLYAVAKDPLIWEQHPSFDRYKLDVFNSFFEESMSSGGALVIQDKISDQVIGSSRYKMSEGSDLAVEIGWSFLSRRYWGGKYNGEMKNLMIDHAFQYVNHVLFYIATENTRSIKAVQKIKGAQLLKEPDNVLNSSNPNNLSFVIHKEVWLS